MRLIGSVNAKTRKIGATSKAAFARERRGFFPRDRQRVQDANRRGVINHTIKFIGRSTHCRIQSITSVSSSVAAGDVRHVIALTLSGALMISPRIPGAVVVQPKYPRNIG